VLEDLGGKISAILDAGPTTIGIESTVLDLTVHPPQILRPGGTSLETLRNVLGKVELNPIVTSQKALYPSQTRSPGVKHKHYAPDAELFVVDGELSAVVTKINELSIYHKHKGNKVGIMCTDETSKCYSADIVKTLGSRSDLADVARNLFRLLREFDEEQVDVILSEGVPTEEIGLAIMNRLRKAAGFKIVKVRAR
jgi:L-threonylcarbamoyladenylate synthase